MASTGVPFDVLGPVVPQVLLFLAGYAGQSALDLAGHCRSDDGALAPG
jgi:hypothetical protein